MNRSRKRTGTTGMVAGAPRLLGGALLVALASGGLAQAHHGFGGRYDLTTPVWVEGVVVEAFFGNPHSELAVRVAGDAVPPSPSPDLGPAEGYFDARALTVPDDVRARTVVLELPPTHQYASLGDRIGEGDRISAVALRNCDPPHQLNVQWLRLPDGGVESRGGAMSYMVEGC